jgi:hypothetical protein
MIVWENAEGTSCRTEITLGRVAEHLAMLKIGCRKCERHGRLRVARLIEEFGAEKGLNELLATLAADCPRQDAHSIYDRCGACYPQLASIFCRDPRWQA